MQMCWVLEVQFASYFLCGGKLGEKKKNEKVMGWQAKKHGWVISDA